MKKHINKSNKLYVSAFKTLTKEEKKVFKAELKAKKEKKQKEKNEKQEKDKEKVNASSI